MWTNFKKNTQCLLRRLILCLLVSALLSTLIYISFYTPIFSSIGLKILNHLPVPDAHEYKSTFSIKTDFIEKISTDSKPSGSVRPILNDNPTAYVVLGGGLTEFKPYKNEFNDKNSKYNAQKEGSIKTNHSIVLNQYSLSRVYTAYINYKNNPLPIILSGVESPWMSDWLLENNISNMITENASMNTCENARFTAKRIELSNVYLITDAYHMTRARRQFALNGIASTPLVAPLNAEKGWTNPKENMIHSWRTVYELVAYARDVIAPQKNCRSADEVSINTLMKSRKSDSNENL